MTKKEKKKKKKVKKSGLSFADDDPSEETENFKLKKSSRYLTFTWTAPHITKILSLGQKRLQQKFVLKSKKNENLKIQKVEVIGVRHTQLIS